MKRILVVDDDEKMRRILWEILRKKAFHVIKAKDAVEAQHLLREGENVDLILLDINMPEVQGDELNAVLQCFHYKTKIIVCSVLPIEEQTKRIPDAADYYDKSESFSVLLDKIDMAFKDELSYKKILIIDDNPQVRMLYRRLLMTAGYYPIDTGDNPASFRFLENQIKNIDLILLDIAMPRISGRVFYEMIKRNYPQAKVIISSVISEDLQRSVIAEADDYYDKSDDYEVLLEKVNRLVGCN